MYYGDRCQRNFFYSRGKLRWPYTPGTNGKAERFVQTCLCEWAYVRACLNSWQRAKELPFFLHRYNWQRPHASIGVKSPIGTLGLAENNLLRLHLQVSQRYVVAEPQVSKAFAPSLHRNIVHGEAPVRTSDTSDATNARV